MRRFLDVCDEFGYVIVPYGLALGLMTTCPLWAQFVWL